MWLSCEPTAGLHSSQSIGLLWNREGLMALRVRGSVCAYGWVCKCSHAWRGYGSPTETADLYTTTRTYPDAFMMNALRTHLAARNCICTHASGPEVRQDADYPFYVDVRSSVPPGLFLTWPILLHCVMLHHCVLLKQTCATVSLLPAWIMCTFIFQGQWDWSGDDRFGKSQSGKGHIPHGKVTRISIVCKSKTQ